MMLLRELCEGINDRGIFKAIFVVGIPGAGKTYTVSKLSGVVAPAVVNTDRATEFLTKKLDVSSNDSTWRSVFVDRSKKITRESLYGYLNGMLPLFVDGTSNNPSNVLARTGLLESIGYDVGMVFVDTPLELAIERETKRAKETNRSVSHDFIKKVHALSGENIEFFKSKYSFFKVVQNVPELSDEEMQRAFKECQSFFSEPIRNPIGSRAVDMLAANKERVLVPTALKKEDLRQICDRWYT